MAMDQTVTISRDLNAHLKKMSHTKEKQKREKLFIGVRNAKGGHCIPLENTRLKNS